MRQNPFRILPLTYKPEHPRMKITDLKCTILGNNPVIRITTDEGICG